MLRLNRREFSGYRAELLPEGIVFDLHDDTVEPEFWRYCSYKLEEGKDSAEYILELWEKSHKILLDKLKAKKGN